MIITIACRHGAGKSTLAKALLQRLPGLRTLDMGGKFREEGKKRGMTIEQFSEHLTRRPSESDKLDRDMDRWQQQEIDRGDLIVTSNVGAMLAPEADLRVFLDCPIDIRARRVFEGARREGDTKFESVESAKSDLLQRDENDRKRYKRLYSFDMFDMKHYDLILNTADVTPDEEADAVVEALKEKGVI